MTPEEIQKKNQLIKAGQYHIIEIPLTQAVMSGSYAISFAIFLVVYILKVIGLSLIPGNELPVWQNCMWLLLLMLIMTARYFHYIARRKELIERYIRRGLYSDDYYTQPQLSKEEIDAIFKRNLERDRENGIPPKENNF